MRVPRGMIGVWLFVLVAGACVLGVGADAFARDTPYHLVIGTAPEAANGDPGDGLDCHTGGGGGYVPPPESGNTTKVSESTQARRANTALLWVIYPHLVLDTNTLLLKTHTGTSIDSCLQKKLKGGPH